MSVELPKVHEKTYTVSEAVCIDFLGAESTRVLATPWLVAWMEMTSRESVRDQMQPGEDTVGAAVSIRHLAPTPAGMKVRIATKLVRVEGRVYSFEVEAFDEKEKIAEATHDRASIKIAKFAARVEAKRQGGRSTA